MIEDVEKLREHAAERLTAFIEELKTECGETDDVTFAVVVSALLFKTGIKLAADHGAPKNILKRAVTEAVGECFEK